MKKAPWWLWIILIYSLLVVIGLYWLSTFVNFLYGHLPTQIITQKPFVSLEWGGTLVWRETWQVEGAQSETLGVQTELITTGLERPIAMQEITEGRYLIAEQRGTIVIVEEGKMLHNSFLDLSERVKCCVERGLLGFVLHPDFAQNPEVFVHYNNREGQSIVSRFDVIDGSADRDSEHILFSIEQPGAQHNGGDMAFYDGYLFVALGEGSGVTDLETISLRPQDPEAFFGKLLRLDLQQSPVNIEVWALGLRNPWRFDIDQASGDIFIGDVGQGAWEEINYIPANRAGSNFGWPFMEGTDCHIPDCKPENYTPPILSYRHDSNGGCAVVGGYVYRGDRLEALKDTYLYGDFCSGKIWAAAFFDDAWQSVEVFDTSSTISSFAKDREGELYFFDYVLGSLFKLVPNGS